MLKRIAIWLLVIVLFCSGTAMAADKSDILKAQKRLIELGYDIGAADGISGIKTRTALEATQRLLQKAGYPVQVTGEATPDILTLLADESCASILRTLTVGSTGSRVKEAQEALIGLGFLQASADGKYGEATAAAAAEFEAWALSYGLTDIEPDSDLTEAELALLTSNLSAYGMESPAYYDESVPYDLKPGYLYAKSVILIDAVSGTVLFEKDADAVREPASTTKIVTLLTALRMCDLKQTVTIPASAADVPQDSSLVPVHPGERMTMEDLLYGLMIRSGNDAANAVAELCSGSVDAFVAEMNRTAAELGMTNTHFENTHGYHAEGHVTTARDLAAAARYGLTQESFARIVTCLRYTLPKTARRDPLTIRVTHEIFDSNSEYYIPHAAGVKSGFTSDAGFCYVGAYQTEKCTLIAVILDAGTRNHAWTDLKRLFTYGEAVFGSEDWLVE